MSSSEKKSMGRRSLPSVTPVTSKLSLVSIIIFTLLSFLNSSCCKASSPSSSCGNIHNISCPFTLKGDNQKCDASFFTQELSCLNNRTVLYLLPDKLLYYVESINYSRLSIRIVDPGIQKNNSTSLPFHSITEDDLSLYGTPLHSLNEPITMIECPSPVKSTRYINITSPNPTSFSASVLGKYYVYSYAYIVAGDLYLPEIGDNCRINKAAWVSRPYPAYLSSRPYREFSNMSEIHDALVYGFELPWSYFYCLKCEDMVLANKGYCDAYPTTDHRLWACRKDESCDLLHLSSYHLSVSCFRQNWNGIMDQLRRGYIRELIGRRTIYLKVVGDLLQLGWKRGLRRTVYLKAIGEPFI